MELAVATTLGDYVEAVVKQALSAHSGIPVGLISLSARAGSLILTVTITVTSLQQNASALPSNTPIDAADTLSKVTALNMTAISSTLNVPLVLRSAPQIEIQTRIIEHQCSPGHWCTASLDVEVPQLGTREPRTSSLASSSLSFLHSLVFGSRPTAGKVREGLLQPGRQFIQCNSMHQVSPAVYYQHNSLH